ncbi:MAG: hypothetical protein ACR2GR_08320 [Rhodothermales bacterium]
MNAVSTSRKTFLVFALLALGAGHAFGQIVDPNPPLQCEDENGEDKGSYLEVDATWQSPTAHIKGRVDLGAWFSGLFDLIKGNGGGETPPPEGGETPPEGGETPPEGGETGETPPEGGETPPEGGETPPEGEGNGGNQEESSSAPDCSTVLQKLHYAKVEITGSNLIVTTAPASAVDIVKVHLTYPVAIPPRVKQRAGLKGNWFVKPGTYSATGRTIRLPLVKRKK